MVNKSESLLTNGIRIKLKQLRHKPDTWGVNSLKEERLARDSCKVQNKTVRHVHILQNNPP